MMELVMDSKMGHESRIIVELNRQKKGLVLVTTIFRANARSKKQRGRRHREEHL